MENVLSNSHLDCSWASRDIRVCVELVLPGQC